MVFGHKYYNYSGIRILPCVLFFLLVQLHSAFDDFEDFDRLSTGIIAVVSNVSVVQFSSLFRLTQELH